MATTRRGFIQAGAVTLSALEMGATSQAVTAHDTLQWFKSEPPERRNKLQLNLERDEKILKAWRNRGR